GGQRRIDSAREAEDGLHGITMPSAVNDPDVMTDAERVAHELGIEYDVVEIQPIAESFFDAFPEAAADQTAAGNVYVRTRAVLNYLVANAENRVVLGTGNRAEAMTGYYTKYGDQAVDCNPIGNLYKQQVRQLAAHVGVPRELVMQEPTAGMWEGQTDAEEIGLDYDTVDAILAVHVDGGLSRAATVRELDVPAEAVDRVVELHDRSAHKRSMPPAPER
ncbi:NAD+ synthase, partial [Halorubrum sp. Ea8]|uniref:NAD+ synthase n=1 Tax=Halorubrum sp. Ea8 TaxID=1383841 RepID=UPI000B9915CE